MVYLDLHADLNVPDAIVDGAMDWMGVAHLLALDGTRPALRDVGLRDAAAGSGRDRARRPRRRPCHARSSWPRSPSTASTTVTLADLAADPKGAARRALAALADCDVLAVHLDVDLVDFLDAAALGERRRATAA